MEENTECKHCRTWEHEIYWKNFTSIHFFLTLPSHFHDHLVLPEKFSAHMKDQLPDKVSLKGPSGVSWDIELLKSDDLVFVGNKWRDFVKANGLKESCLLLFKYERNSSFEVLVFDQGNCCEMESTYFAKNWKHNIKSNEENQKKRDVRDDGEEEGSCVASKKQRKDDAAEVCSDEKENASTPKKGVLSTASKGKPRPRKQKAESTRIINEKNKVVSHMSQRDVIATENGESYLKKVESHKSEAQSKKSLNKNDEAEAGSRKKIHAPRLKKGAISATLNYGGRPRTRRALSIARRRSIIKEKGKEVSHTSERDVIIVDGSSSSEKDDFHISRARSRKQPSFLVTTSKSRDVSENLIPIQDEARFGVTDYSHTMEAQSEKFPSRIHTSKELSLIKPVNKKVPQLMYYSRRIKGQAGKQPSAHGIAKMFQSDYYRGRFPEDKHSLKSHATIDGGCSPNKQVLPTSSIKPVLKSASEGKRSYKKVVSNRRNVTETDKENALQRANQKQTEDSFTVVLRPSSVHPRYFMHIPAKWVHKHPLQGYQEVILRVGEKAWHTTFFSYVQSQGLGTGWNKFVLDNSLEEFDVLVFKPVNLKDEALVLDVDIFKVV